MQRRPRTGAPGQAPRPRTCGLPVPAPPARPPSRSPGPMPQPPGHHPSRPRPPSNYRDPARAQRNARSTRRRLSSRNTRLGSGSRVVRVERLVRIGLDGLMGRGRRTMILSRRSWSRLSGGLSKAPSATMTSTRGSIWMRTRNSWPDLSARRNNGTGRAWRTRTAMIRLRACNPARRQPPGRCDELTAGWRGCHTSFGCCLRRVGCGLRNGQYGNELLILSRGVRQGRG